jgi:tetratricopeptide (TPR) repeat protein
MLLTITYTGNPATDLGYLLHKSPSRVHSFEQVFGKAHVGDLVLDGKDGGNFILIARTGSSAPWQSDPYPQTAEGLNSATKDLAEKILENHTPALAGVLFLNQGRVELALRVLKQASDEKPKDLAAKLALCQGMEANELYEDAVNCYTDARNMNPSSPEEVDERLAQARWLYGKDGNRQLALQNFEELAYTRHYTRALLGLGMALDGTGEHDRALSVYEEFLRAGTDPRSVAIAHVGRATTIAKLGKHEEALAEFKMALDTIPGDALVLVQKAVELASAGDLDAGITELQSVLGQKNEADDVVPFASYRLGELLVKKGELEKASEQFRTATEWRPDYKEAHDSLAKSLTRLSRLPEALAEFSQVAKLSSKMVDRKYTDVLANQWLGNTLQDLCDYAGAASAYQTAIHLKPDYRIAYSELGHVFERQGQRARAIEEYRKALAAGPNELDITEWFVITDIRLGEALLKEGKDLEAISRSATPSSLTKEMSRPTMGWLWRFKNRDVSRKQLRSARQLVSFFLTILSIAPALGSRPLGSAQTHPVPRAIQRCKFTGVTGSPHIFQAYISRDFTCRLAR